MKLLIVESPGKIKKLKSFLPPGWEVAASAGHIRDLPHENDGLVPPSFKPNYIITKSRQKTVRQLKNLVQQAEEVYLGTDPDREGEAIAWHLKEVLGLPNNCKRVTYTAITKDDVLSGIRTARAIDMNWVYAQEARRAIDRIIGFGVSAALGWKIAEKGVSAGRVQTPALGFLVRREQEIQNFCATTHYGAALVFSGGWQAKWLPKEGDGWLKEGEDYVLDKTMAEEAASAETVTVTSCEKTKRPPLPPFTTSQLLQAASAILKFKPAETMALAQSLYEAGHITYMRTDCPNLSETAAGEIRAYAEKMGLSLPPHARQWPSKEGAQEAHEAIRPVRIEDSAAGKTPQEKALYTLIRNRALASQLGDAAYTVVTLTLTADIRGKKAIYQARSETAMSPDLRYLLQASGNGDGSGQPVPELPCGTVLSVAQRKVDTLSTHPRPRFKEATLIREMEKEGIGRPSTYAATLRILTDQTKRKYTREEKGYLIPTEKGEKVFTALDMAFTFPKTGFTRHIEETLDQVHTGQKTYRQCISDFYRTFQTEYSAFIKNREKGPQQTAVHAPAEKCARCGSALRHLTGKSAKTGKNYDFFACTGKKCGAAYPNKNGKPDTSCTPAAKTGAAPKTWA